MEAIRQNTTKKHITLYLFIFIVLCCAVSTLQAQGWHKKYPSDFPWKNATLDGFIEIAPSLDKGTVIAIQEFIHPDTFQLAKKTVKLIKIDQEGAIQWQHKYNMSGTLINPVIDEIQPTFDNGYIVSGHFNPVVNQHGYFFVKKYDQSGTLEWEKSYTSLFSFHQGAEINSITPTLDNGYIVTGKKEISSTTIGGYVIKIDSVGTIIWDQSYTNKNFKIKKVITNQDDTYTMTGRASYLNDVHGFLLTIDASGNVLLDSVYNDNDNNSWTHWEFIDVVRTDDSGYLAVGSDVNFAQGSLLLVKMDSLGVVEWSKSHAINNNFATCTGLVKADNGYMLSAHNDGQTVAYVVKVNLSGNLVWIRIFPGSFKDLTSPEPGMYCFAGYQGNEAQVVKLGEDGHIYSNFLTGQAVYDSNFNCNSDSLELSLQNWMVEAAGTNGTFYGVTDPNGFYEINIDSGTYNLQLILPSTIWSACQSNHSVYLVVNDTINTDFTPQSAIDCPSLTVDISVPFLRNCDWSIYTVSYCNQGTIAAFNPYLEIDFQTNLNVVSSTNPWISQSGNSYTFLLDTLNPGDCGMFTIKVTPDCDSTIIGQTMCVTAHIFPDSICEPSDPSWDGSITTLDVNCGQDSVTFTITNTGNGDMQTPLEYFVIEDHLNMKQGLFQLNSMESFFVKVPSNGSTYRIYAAQAVGHFPANYFPTLAIEGCGLNSSGTFSQGYITQFNENDVLDQVSIDCQEIIGPYDPNDKRAEPKGYDAEHYIKAGVDLNYHIRFQNVGNDTAFTVVIRDTISDHLDIASLQQGTSSHLYNLDVVNGNVLKFTFNNILLVDSTTNEPESHGFVKFKISQVPNLSIGTKIHNSAGIYFDFNEPIITNQTYHEIGEDFIPVLVTSNEVIPEYPELSIKVQPNPFTEYADFILNSAPIGDKSFELYDATGRLIHQERFI